MAAAAVLLVSAWLFVVGIVVFALLRRRHRDGE